MLAASPDTIVCYKPGNTNLPSCFGLEYIRTCKKLVNYWLTVNYAIDKTLPDLALTVSESTYKIKKNYAFYYQVHGVNGYW